MKRLLLPAVLACCALLHAAPDEVSFQGRLADASGRPRTALALSISVEVYDAPSGGTRLYGPEAHAVDVVNGVFDFRIGSVLPGLGAALRAAPDRWVQLTVAGTPLSGRSKLAAQPYALAVAAGSVGPLEIRDASLTAPDLATGSVTGVKIASGQVSNGHIASVAWTKITSRPASLGGPAVASGGTVFEPVASTLNFLPPFTVTAPSSGKADVGLDASSVTLQGNAVNQANALARLDGSAHLAAAQLSGNYAGVTGVGTVASGTWTATAVGVPFGGTGASTVAGARAGLLAASTATMVTAGTGLKGGGTLTGGWSVWIDTAAVSGGCSGAAQKLLWSTTTLRLECGMDLDTDAASMGGDVTGAQSANTVTAIRGRPVASTAPADGDLLRWSGTDWRASPDTVGTIGAGTAGKMVKWTGVYPSSASLGNSLMSYNGSGVAVAGDLVATGNISGPNVTSGVDPGHTHTAYALTSHKHDAADVDGFLSSDRGGTGLLSNWLPQPFTYAFTNAWSASLYFFDTKTPDGVRDNIGAASLYHTHGNFLNLSGADNYLGRFNDPGSIQASLLYQSDSDYIGLGTTAPAAQFHMRGTGNPMLLAEETSTLYDRFGLEVLGGKTGINISVPASGAGTFKGMRLLKAGSNTNDLLSLGAEIRTDHATNDIGVHGVATGSGGGMATGLDVQSDGHTIFDTAIHTMAQAPNATNYGLYGEATGAGTNYGIYATASGAGTNIAAQFDGDAHVEGAISKLAGTFDIPHPDPAKAAAGWRLRHSFVESPSRGDNLYRWAVQVENGRGSVALPAYFEHLNEDVKVWVFPRDHAGSAYGRWDPAAAALEVFADSDGAYNVIAVGTRKDPGAHKGFDAKGLEYRAEGGHP